MADAPPAPNEALAPLATRPDLLGAGAGRLRAIERFTLRFVRRTFEPGRIDRIIRILQRAIGSTWIHHFTKHLRHVYGLDRLPPFGRNQSFILVANHRSFFDLYVVFGHLVRTGLRHRIVFPVRADFFYTSLTGLFVNGVMSFFAMYPPIFRERKKLALNPPSLDELAWLLRRGGFFCGLHPEGTRKKDDDPYTFLPAQRGVGRVIHEARVPVIPVFINGLLPNDLPRQVSSNFDGTGRKILVVFGAPIDFSDLFAEPGTPKIHQAIADRTLEAIGALGQEEREKRAELGG
ncbi:MAG TPA: 1-acyl-sn-glycerol-3-phosphate acyltransferase [Polyangiaceae bacterium]|jgi:1-acyl-sn-glycerol-3-phosphate acyltransferase|nr:1-acyl-sn-glycerol-3-phosphate acyltransferase [Polyangiaceae bacterium]